MSQQQQHMEFTDLNRKFQESMTYNPQPYPMNGKMSTPAQMPTQMPPQMPPQMFSNIMPNMMPMPLMPMRSGVDMDYNRWMADSYQAAYRGVSAQQPQFGYEPVTQMQPLPKTHSANHLGKVNTSRSSSPMEDCNSPRFGPGPPIVTSEKVKGPRGCNLFVFHLPNEITNWDMYLLFRRFGTILSVHTMVNKSTGLSKGFGFVSYSAHQEAHAAISEMDGFRLGKKRLKVQLKRSQDDNPDLLGDEDEDDDGSEAPFYPNAQYDGQSAHQDQLLQQRQHLEHSQSRCASFASNFSSSGYETSGHTTRASTPPLAPLAVRGSCNDSTEGYFDGVNSSTGHSPVDELEQQEQQQMEDMFGQMRAKGGAEESEQLTAAAASRDGDDSKVPVVGVPTAHQSRSTTDSKKTSAEKNRGAK